jgi:REP element-mobilizing transposase RayT
VSAPRQVLPEQCVFVTRRCTQRQFLLVPERALNEAVLYCLAEAALRTGLQVLWFVALSNHIHYALHDAEGRYPEFIEHFHKMLARVLNAYHGRWENFWASEQASVVRMLDASDVLDKMIYSLCNPVAAHLVTRATEWPGASSLVAQYNDKTLVLRRPAWFFAEDGVMPAEVELRFARPRGFEHLSHDAWQALIRERIAAKEVEHAADRETRRVRVMGRNAVMNQSPKAKPRTSEPRRGLRPTIACRNKWRRIEALQRCVQFRQQYRQALTQRRAGDIAVLFPHGAYKLVQLGLVGVHPPPP